MLKATFEKSVSAEANPPAGSAWSVAAEARIPGAKLVALGEAALQVPPIGVDARSLTTRDVGKVGVRVLLIKSVRAESEWREFGET